VTMTVTCVRSVWTILVVVLVDILNVEDRRRISLKSCSVLFKIRGSNLMLSSQIVPIVRNSFHTHPKHFMSSFHFWSSEGHNSEDLFVLNVQLSFTNSPKLLFLHSSPNCSGALFK
jgi:hypothetical protein